MKYIAWIILTMIVGMISQFGFYEGVILSCHSFRAQNQGEFNGIGFPYPFFV